MTDQILRTIDKHDKLGTDGVVELLQKPPEEFGCDLDPIRAGLIGQFLDCKGGDNSETLENMREYFSHARRVTARIRLMTAMEQDVEGRDTTPFDDFLAMPANDDETWRNGGRPKNIAWALDDILLKLFPAKDGK